MAEISVKGNLDVSEGVINSVRTNQEALPIASSISVTLDSPGVGLMSGAGSYVITLPNVATVPSTEHGWTMRFTNRATASCTFRLFGTSTDIGTVAAGLTADVQLIASLNTASGWKIIQIDQTGSGITKFASTFTATDAQWVLTSGEYALTVTETTHGAGTNPVVLVEESIAGGLVFEEVIIEKNIAANGDVNITVNEDTGGHDGRFAGRITIF